MIRAVNRGADRATDGISVALIDDHDVIHAGVRAWFAGCNPPIELVADYPHPAAFLADHPRGGEDIDVVLFDLQYERFQPEFETLRRVCEAGHRVIVYSHMATDEVILSSLDAGAITFLAKGEDKQHLFDAVYAAHANTPYVGPRMAKALFNDRTVGRPGLSTREREVLIAWFQTENKEFVAKRLFIEPSTVRTHLQRARAKYAAVGRPAPTKAALIARAVQDGILSIEDL
ncbi:response regulator transcription factor [Mycolicibacterium diernhoferi]|uniref:DNA-binding response regulator n=1 Tax=Mycolicibacterium diernhoferi TaxID=1801 RepID=A0A1Q4HEH6_9MYCO|nr:response regulator transcription factor [Mycolicibacterium diernhoferi]OJZ65923.1 LuxR family transcriptional regulator [Mycolicibacterium diernhoferi]OPE50581.1 LuxR family transcriptional regulator [Mycolicibacterium diernhoferi]PEG53296.1 DNA-binding response regulator [Mycolicibacterium diernhoferi]QYL23830.1 response regulator transcription factor [Mycolicibacterium diernhoferi]